MTPPDETVVERLVRSFDHLDPALDHTVLTEVYQRFATGCPVRSTDAHGGFKLVTRHDDINDIARQPEAFSSTPSVLHPVHEGRPPSIPIEFDPPAHPAYRKLFMDVLSAPQVKRVEPWLRELTDRLLTDFIKGPELDFVHGVAAQLPIRAIGHLLGWGEDATEQMQEFAATVLEHLGQPKMLEAFASLAALATEEINDRKRNPRDDYLTKLIQTDFDGRPLTDDELLNIFRTFVFAGYETTTHALSSLIHHLAMHPELQERLRADPALVNTAVEEGLRLFPPVQTMFRTVRTPTELRGVRLEAGDRLALLYGPANLDPQRFECPAEFRIDRETARQHISFGAGAHYCAGAPLARAEMRIMLEALTTYPPYELAGEPKYLPHLMMGQMMGVDYLPLRFAES